MKRILLLVSPSRISSTCIDRAFRAAAEPDTELTVVFILDTTMTEDVRARLKDLGFLGKLPSSRLLSELRGEQERQGREELARIEREAERLGVRLTTKLVVGDFLSESLEVADTEAADVIFVARRERPRLSRLIGGSDAEDLRDSAPCRVVIHEAKRGS